MTSHKLLRKPALVLALSAMVVSGTALADSTLTSYISMDNGYLAYISTSDSVQGTQFGSGNSWPTTFSDSTSLAAGTDYYLHVFGYDQGGIAGFLGKFTLSGSDHLFANASTTLLTNTVDWQGNNSGFNGTYGTLADLGNNGVGPWGTRPLIDTSARWIWSGDAYNNDSAYFTTKISAVNVTAPVPEPETYAMMFAGLGLLAAIGRRRKQRVA